MKPKYLLVFYSMLAILLVSTLNGCKKNQRGNKIKTVLHENLLSDASDWSLNATYDTQDTSVVEITNDTLFMFAGAYTQLEGCAHAVHTHTHTHTYSTRIDRKKERERKR